jgi:energy-coupling factor transporter ATP-binding protein EcfA2
MTARDAMELGEEAIRAQYPAALALLAGFDHAPRIAAAAPAAAAPDRSPGVAPVRARFRSTVPGLSAAAPRTPGAVRLIERVDGVGDGLPTPLQAATLGALRRALAIALAMGAEFAAQAGLAELKRANLEGRLPEPRRAEFGELVQAEALVVLHVMANAAAFLIAPHLGPRTVEVGAVEEVLADNAPLALMGALWELDQDLARHGSDDAAQAATLAAFAEALMERVRLRADGAPRLAAFTGGSWRVAADGLTLAGFAPARARRGAAPAMAFKAPRDVVGNHIAKHQAQRLARMLMAYDLGRRMNPFAELGGFIFTFLGDGKPGTGKTTLIQMMAGLIHGYCETAGTPFVYRNFSIDQIDSYQGKSGQNARAFVEAVLDPAVIGFGTIDDIDQVAGRRGDRQSSAGQQEVTAVFMQAFAGAGTVVRGNCTFGMFSNFPENVDDALRQRAGARFLIDGPQSRADYTDLLALLLGRHHAIPMGAHDFLAAQEITRAVAASYAAHDRPQEAPLARVHAAVLAEVGPLDTIAALGAYLTAIREADPRFTGRAVKNITDAVKARALDIDLPEDWMTEPDRFLRKDYPTKLAMIRELMVPITPAMVLQEINRYADSEFRFAGSSDDRAVDALVQDMTRAEAAKRRFLAGREG